MQCSGITPFTLLDFPEHTACVLFLPGCNMRCKFCHNAEFVLPEKIRQMKDTFIDEETVFNFLRSRKGKLDGVVISGGEPTVHAELVVFIRKIKEFGFQVKLDTNGNNPVMLKQLIDEDLIDYIAMDVKTSIDQYQSLVSVQANVTYIDISMDVIRSAGIPYEFRATLIKECHTPEILQNMSAMFEIEDMLYLQQFRPATTLDPTFATYHGFSEEEMDKIADTYFRPVTKKTIIRT